MTNAISKLHDALETWSFKYNCYEAVHPWTPFCSQSALEVGLTVFSEAIKLYTPLYLFSQLVQRRYDYKSFQNTANSILRSTTFISCNAFFALLFFCSSQYFTGKFYYYAVAYLPGFVASSMAVMIEKPNRRSSLAFYVANVASEALFRIYVAKGFLRPVKNGQVYIFTLSIATLMMLAKKHGFEDDPLSTAIKVVVGAEEANTRKRRKGLTNLLLNNELDSQDKVGGCTKALFNNNNDLGADLILEKADTSRTPMELRDEQNNMTLTRPQPPTTGMTSVHTAADSQNSSDFLLNRLRNIYSWLRFVFKARHTLCPHQDCSCLYYVTKASIRAFFIGLTAQFGLKLSSKAAILIKNPRQIGSIISDPGLLKIGLFLSTFSGLYKATNCWLRWSLDTSKPLNCFISGLVAGPALLIYPSPTVALYVLWKCMEALYNEATRVGLVKNKDLYIVILYGLATSQLFYSALMDPRYMKKSYMAFLDQISHHKLHMINRSVLDVFGTEASSGYEEFFPDLHPKYMSRAFLGSIWIWMIEHKFVAKQCASS